MIPCIIQFTDQREAYPLGFAAAGSGESRQPQESEKFITKSSSDCDYLQ